MIQRLCIKNFALIDNLDIHFDSNFNVITGETGAGKSIILGALSLILGQRIDSKYFFNQQNKCIIEGFFDIKNYSLQDFFSQNEIDYLDISTLRREISLDGRSRAFINDTPVNLTLLKALGEQLIDIHSQHAILEINDEKFQLLVVDTFADNLSLVNDYKNLFVKRKIVRAKLTELQESFEKQIAERDLNQFHFEEISKLKLIENEQNDLENEQKLLSNAEQIKSGLVSAYALLNDDDTSVIARIKNISQTIKTIEKYAPSLSEIIVRLDSSLVELKDIAQEVDSVQEQTQLNEERLEYINERLSTIYQLQKKHRVDSIKELIDLGNELEKKLTQQEGLDTDIQKLAQELRSLEKELCELAQSISERRSSVLNLIENDVMQVLQSVSMPDAIVKINNPKNEISPSTLKSDGIDNIQILFSANKGQNPMPLNKVASGGELSRLMLAIKSLIAKKTSLPSIIFDEIDTGISGEVAVRVGKIIQQLSENMQVFAITHLPQIAAKGTSHYYVYKLDAGEQTISNIKKLSTEERVYEIATMLSGHNPSSIALENAKQLLGL